MSKKYLTLLVIPHNEDRIRELNISRTFFWGLLTVCVISLCALIFHAIGYYIQLNREIEFSVLQTENEELKVQFERVQKRLKTLRNQVDGLTQIDRKLRAWVSFSEPGEDVRKMGAGGISEEVPLWENRVSYETSALLTQTHTDLDQLLREARFLQTSFDSIRSYMTQNEQERRHLPSILPLPPDAEYWYSSGFGWRTDPFTGRRQFHKGLDIAGHKGTDILATADGVVKKVGRDKLLGWYVSIDHGSGLSTLYAHLLKRPPVKKTQKVQRGGVIGKMGNSGRSTAPHLHYAVNRDKLAKNPKLYIFDKRTLSVIY